MNHINDIFIKREKQKARDLRKSRWWQNLIANDPTCHYCLKSLDKASVTMDHLIPISKGGISSKGNVVPCCKECNNKKKNLTPVDIILDRLALPED